MMVNPTEDTGPTPGRGLRQPSAVGALSRRRVIGGAAAGLGAAVFDPGVALADRQPAEPGVAFSPATVRVLQAIIASGAGGANVPGLNVGIWVPGRGSYVKALGVGDLAKDAPLTLQDHFRIASITKTFTATAILQLVDQKQISLNDRLERYITGIPYGDQITIEQMLGMTSGIYDYVSNAGFLKAYVANPLLPFSLRRLVAIIRQNKPFFPPGTDIAYDNSNYYLLGAIAEKVSGMPLTRLIAEKITRPLGLHDTSYPATPAIPAPLSRGYLIEAASFQDITDSNPAVPGGAGAMISTLLDLKTWVKALATGTLLTPATQARRLKTKVLTRTPSLTIRYGLGISSFNGFLGHDGAIFGYGSTAVYLPARDATIVAICNAGGIVANPMPLYLVLALAAYLFPEHFRHGI